jgi:hypothetical protein
VGAGVHGDTLILKKPLYSHTFYVATVVWCTKGGGFESIKGTGIFVPLGHDQVPISPHLTQVLKWGSVIPFV